MLDKMQVCVFMMPADFTSKNAQVRDSQNLRNYGMDCLRILSMYMVVVLHVLGQGGILDACEKFSFNYYVAWFLETSCYCAVNVFAMITGYVMINVKFNAYKMIPLYLTVLFYSAIITIVFKFSPYLMQFHKVSYHELVKGICFPVVSRQYWYFSSYFALYFFIPFINKMLHSLNKREHKILCVCIIIIYSILPLFCLGRMDSFTIGRGYTTAWLTSLYIFGSYIKLNPIKIGKLKCLSLYLLCIFLAWFAKYSSHVLIKYLFFKNTELDLFIDYPSIFIIGAALALLLLFSQINIKRAVLQKIIQLISSVSFSVYLIHCQPFIFSYVLVNKFSYLANESAILLIAKVILFSFLIFVVCSFVDLIRYNIFRMIKVDGLPRYFSSLVFSKKLIENES